MKTYTYDEAYDASVEYFNGNEMSAHNFLSKYALRNENDELVESTPDDMHWRIAKEINRIEKGKFKKPLSIDLVFSYLQKYKKIIPQGSPMYGIGNKYKTISLSNCFVVESPHDSYGGICRTDEQIAQISKRRGGIGFDISNVRPEKLRVNNAARTTTGMVSFMHRWSNTGREVGQEGRRAAEMISCSVHHPDIEKFATVKNDDTSVTGANISVRLSNEFLNAVANDEDYEQRWPVDDITSPKISRMVNARKVWNTIIHSAWLRAEPGLLFWDNIINESPADCYSDLGYKTIGTNPCFTKDMLLLTNSGYKRFDSIINIEQDVLVDNRISYSSQGLDERPENWKIDNDKIGTSIKSASGSFLTQKNQKILKITTNRGFIIRCTENHHIATTEGMIEAKDLTENHKILVSKPNTDGSIVNKSPNGVFESLSLLIGLIAGDGTFDKNRKRVHLDFWGNDKERIVNICTKIIDNVYSIIGPKFNKRNRTLSKYFIINDEKCDKIRISSSWLYVILKDLFNFDKDSKLRVPKLIMENSRTDMARYYLAGLFYTDGTVVGSKGRGFTIRLSQSNKEFIQEVQLLLHSIGIITNIYKRRDVHTTTIKGKTYICKSQYELITTCGSIIDFHKQIGFLQSDKDIKLNKIISSNNIKYSEQIYDYLVDKKDDGYEDVYCIREPETRSIIVNGISTRRCGEIPLSAYDSCRLLAINLFHCIKNPFKKDAYFDFNELYETAQIAQRIMDDIVDLEIECIDKILAKINKDPEPDDVKKTELELWNNIRSSCINGRRTGVGITALGDVIAALGLRYGSDESIEVVDEIYKMLKFGCYRASVDMAKELGAFPIWDYELEKDNPFLNRMKNESVVGEAIYNDMKKYGRRNIACLTTAPTGTTSTQASLEISTSNGIVIYFNTTSGIEPAIFIDYTRRKKINPNDENTRVDFIDKLGDRWQEFKVFHSGVEAWMAVTGETDTTKSPYYKACANDIDWVSRVKLQAAAQKHVDHAISSTINLPSDVKEEDVARIYEAAWKAGLKGITVYREGSRTGVLVQNVEKELPVERPRELPCDVHHVTVNHQQYFVLVGLVDGKPYEVFAGKNGILDKSLKTGTITRKKANFYKAEFENDTELSPITASMSEMEEVISRLTSGLLRSGADMHFIVKQLEKVGETKELHSFARGLARTLKKYIPDGTDEGEKCDKCGGNILRIEGCKTCQGCGNSACT